MDLNDSFTENLLQRSHERRDYLNSKMNEGKYIVGRKRTALCDRNTLDDSPKRPKCSEPSGAKNEMSEAEDLFEPKVLSNVRGLAALRKQTTPDSTTVADENIHGSEKENKANIVSSTKPLSILKNEDVKNFNCNEILSNSAVIEKEDSSSSVPESHSNSDPAVIPLAARKAMFEKASLNHNVISKGPAFQPQLSVAKRAAMFENAAKINSQVTSQSKLMLPKRFVPPGNREVCTKEEKDSSMNETANSSTQSSVFNHTEETTPTESLDVSSDVQALNPAEQSWMKNSTSSLEKSISDDVFDTPKQTQGDSKETSINSICTDIFEEAAKSNSSPNESDKESSIWAKKELETPETVIGDGMKTTSDPLRSLGSSKSTNSIGLQSKEKLIESSIAHPLQEDFGLEDDKKILSCLVNHWETMSSSSSIGNSNSEGEPSIRQSEKSSIHTYGSEDDQADCESNLESEFAAAESMSEYNDGESVLEGKLEEGEKYPSDFEDNASEQEVFNPAKFSAAAGLLQFDVQTDSMPPTEDETSSLNGQKFWQRRNFYTHKTDNRSITSAISEASLYSEATSSLETSHSQIYSSSESLGSNVLRDIAEKEASGRNCDSPLVHTVSFYRKQRLGSKSSPTVTTKRPHHLSVDSCSPQKKLKLLQEEVVRQQAVIGQTSQALNLCHSKPQFSGSSEQIEAERLLLIATKKKQACEFEIQSLISQDTQEEMTLDRSGTLVITDIKLPLKREFIALQQKGDISSTQYFICLICFGPYVIVTPMVSTNDKVIDGALCFSNYIKLEKLPPDFSVAFEVYTLQTKKGNHTLEKKLSMKREYSKIRLHGKSKKTESKYLFPANKVGCSNAVRTPSFSLVGRTLFSVKNWKKTCFSLDKISYSSPLEGILTANLHLQTDRNTAEKGFLTRFEDVGGYGLWHRLWCSLDSHILSYWKYPDDETHKEPMGVIDLKQCVTSEVGPVSRDVCARPNTVLMVTMRPRKEGDGNTLVSESVGLMTTTRHLLSADTKEERIVWCNKLNEALENVRKWDAQALCPSEISK